MPKKLTTEEFIKRARAVHGGRYGYEKVVYVNARSKVEIICSEHGSFFQNSRGHLRGGGCLECCKKIYSTPKTTNQWVKEAIAAHGDRYDYSNSIYSNRHGFVEINCKEHGPFRQRAVVHLMGHGCPRCKGGYANQTKLYLLTNGEQIKVGISLNVERRMSECRKRGQPFTSDLVATWSLPDHSSARAVESKVHRLLSDHNAGLKGFDGATEWFNVSPQVAADAIKRCLP